YLGRERPGHTRMAGATLDVLVEVLIDAVDKDRDRRIERAQPRQEMAVGVAGGALHLDGGEIEKPNEMVNDAVQSLVGHQARQLRSDFQAVGPANMLERRRRDGREPQLRPRQRRGGEEGECLLAKDLVADWLLR